MKLKAALGRILCIFQTCSLTNWKLDTVVALHGCIHQAMRVQLPALQLLYYHQEASKSNRKLQGELWSLERLGRMMQLPHHFSLQFMALVWTEIRSLNFITFKMLCKNHFSASGFYVSLCKPATKTQNKICNLQKKRISKKPIV